MTAKQGRDAGTTVGQGLMVLDRLRGHWLVVTFAMGGLLWADDQWEVLQHLPARVAAVEERLDDTVARIETLEELSLVAGISASAAEPGPEGPAVADAPPGGWSQVRLALPGTAPDCGPVRVMAELAEEGGRSFPAETTAKDPVGPTSAGWLSFAVRIDPAMRPGRALMSLMLERRCGGEGRVALVSSLPFHVLEG